MTTKGKAKMSKALRAEYAELFLSLDRDGNGWLSRKELSRWLRHDSNFSKSKSKIVFGMMDANHDGKISLDEFYAAMNEVSRPAAEDSAAVLRREFDLLDTERNGKLTMDQMRIGIKNGGSAVGKGMCTAIVQLTADVAGEMVFEEVLMGAIALIV